MLTDNGQEQNCQERRKDSPVHLDCTAAPSVTDEKRFVDTQPGYDYYRSQLGTRSHLNDRPYATEDMAWLACCPKQSASQPCIAFARI